MTHSTYPILDLTFIAAEDLSAKQYMLVEMAATEGQVQLHKTADTWAVGILRNKPTSGQTAVVRILGVTEAKIGSDAVAYGEAFGDELSTDTPTGYIATVTATESVYGRVLNASGSTSGDKATVVCNFIIPVKYADLA